MLLYFSFGIFIFDCISNFLKCHVYLNDVAIHVEHD